ncbi:hypothetical protein ES706_00740 [subsurface metagenome]
MLGNIPQSITFTVWDIGNDFGLLTSFIIYNKLSGWKTKLYLCFFLRDQSPKNLKVVLPLP